MITLLSAGLVKDNILCKKSYIPRRNGRGSECTPVVISLRSSPALLFLCGLSGAATTAHLDSVTEVSEVRGVTRVHH